MTVLTPRKETTAQRVARHRATGVRIDVVLTDPDVIAAWGRLTARTRTQRQAVALAVMLADTCGDGADNGQA